MQNNLSGLQLPISPVASSRSVSNHGKPDTSSINLHSLITQDFTADSSLFVTDPSRSVIHMPKEQYATNGLDFDASDAELPAYSPETIFQGPSKILNNDSLSPPRNASDSFLSDDNEFSASSNEFQDSSFLNDTRAQFDLDINIDDRKIPKTSSFPWRNASIRQSSLLTSRNITHNTVAESSSSQKIEELTKQLTNCRIQLRLYDKFLQDLIDRRQIDVGDLTELQENLEDKEHASKLEQEHAEMCSLVEDLYASLEDYQSKWRDSDQRTAELTQNFREFAGEVAEIVALSKATVDSDPANPKSFLAQAMPILRSEMESKGLNPLHQTIESLQHEYSLYKRERASVELALRQQIEDGKGWQQEYKALTTKYNNLRKESDTSAVDRLQDENDRLSSLNEKVDIKLQEYQVMIDRLQREVNEFKDLSRKGSLSDVTDPSVFSVGKDRDRLLLLQRDFDNLQRQYDDMAREFERYKESSEGNNASLANQLSNRKREVLNLRAEHSSFDNLQHDLEVAVEKQRVLTSDKIRLSYQVESLSKDKTNLQNTIDGLTEKIASASSKPGDESLRKLVGYAEHQFDSLFLVDVREFDKLLQSFNKIADDLSLKEPKRKIQHLSEVLAEGPSVLGRPVELVSTIKEYHKSVFDYFARAVDVIVTDHIRLLLKESETTQTVSVTETPHKQGGDLQKQKDDFNKENTSLEYSMRIEELSSRWKSEREARVYENKQAQKRLRELERENARLRAK